MDQFVMTEFGTPGATTHEIVVQPDEAGTRLDALLAQKFPHCSRVFLRKVIHAGNVLVNELLVRAAFRLKEGNRIQVRLPDLPAEGPEPEDIPLEILYEDEHLAAINKPPHMVVHPARGNWKGTLTAALAHHFQQLSDAGGPARPGVVHRLDRETSGVIVIAKTNRAHFELSSQFESRVTEKEYRAIVCGHPDRDRDLLDLPIGIHPYQREKMAIRADHSTSREAQTFYEVLERFSGFAFMRLVPRTGRTHQLRVHLAHIHLPVLCDRQYGGRCEIRQGELRGDRDDTLLLSRQALHAYSLRIQHPITRLPLEFVAPLPDDMQRVLDELRQFRSTVGR
jgi:23S rRNA pseudouridine1911/1915/1917 synthase